MAGDVVRLTLSDAEDLSQTVLRENGVSPAQADAIVRSVMAAERDACASHGLYRLLGYVRTARSELSDAAAEPVVSRIAGAIVRVDAACGFSPLALERGLPEFIGTVRRQGVAVLAVNRCFHMAALWPEVERVALEGLAVITCTPTQSFVAPAGGIRRLLGTNPFAFGWPRPGRHPYVFDFATSTTARGEIELRGRRGEPIPADWGLDEDGKPTTDPEAALAGAMTVFGGHKGSALATMVELLSGPLIGDLTSAESTTVDGGRGCAPLHGQIMIAFHPESFAFDGLRLEGAENLFAAIEQQGARLPSVRRYQAREKSEREGIAIPAGLFAELQALVDDHAGP